MKHILVVDDQPENLYLLTALLRGHGFTVAQAENGAEALIAGRRSPPDLIISDLLMPVLDGYSLLRQWRADAVLKAVPFIVFTATYTRPRDERLAMAMGADAFLIKPAEPEAILDCIRRVEAQHRNGQLPSMRARRLEERELLQEYNEILLQKIEQKVLETNAANDALRREVAERERAQDELRESARRFRATFEQAAIGILHLGLDGKIAWANRKLCAMCGYAAEEIVGVPFLSLTHPDWRAEAEAVWRAMLSRERATYEAEKLYLRKDGSTFWGNLVATLVCNEGGQPTYFISVIADVTERRRMVETLRWQDRAIQAVSQGITITDARQPDNLITYASEGFERITGYPVSEVIGRNCRLLQGEGTDPAQVTRLRQAIAAGQPTEVELLNYRKDGTPFWNQVSINPVRDDLGRIAYFVGVQSDVTARKRMEAELLQWQKMEALGQLAGGIAHDFNNHLTVIAGYSDEILAFPDLPLPIHEAVAAISEAGERAAGLTRQLLGFSRQALIQPRVVNLNAEVEKIGKLLRRLIGENIALHLDLAPDLHHVKMDVAQIDQILMNLAVNARDAMPRGGQLTIQTANVALTEDDHVTPHSCQPGPHVFLAMTDTGTGMTAEVRARVFEPFFTTKGVGHGTGLGLATLLGIVQQNNGCIHLQSEPGSGSCFKIYLPAVLASEAPKGGDRSLATKLPPTQQETILLVEDDEEVRRLAEMALTRQGYRVIVARDGTNALALVAEWEAPINLVLTDVVMPHMGGPELVQRLKERFPQLRVVFMSGYTDDAVVRHGLLDASVAFIQKPYTRRTLAAKVREVLDGRPLDEMA